MGRADGQKAGGAVLKDPGYKTAGGALPGTAQRTRVPVRRLLLPTRSAGQRARVRAVACGGATRVRRQRQSRCEAGVWVGVVSGWELRSCLPVRCFFVSFL